MSEVLRDLVVSLSLDSDNFTRNLTSINKQIQEAESEFKRAAAGVKDFEKSASGARAELDTLAQKFSLQQKAVTQYERALEAASKKLETANARQGKLSACLSEASTQNADLKAKVDAATTQYEKFRRKLGDTDSATIAAKDNLDALSQEYAESSAEVKKLEGQLAANTKSLQNNADAVTKARTGLNQAQAAVKQTEAQIKSATDRLARMQSAWTKTGETLTAFGAKCAAVSTALSKVGKGMTAALTTPVLALGTAAIKASIDFESAFTGVRKTVDATEQEYEELSDAVKQMSTELATSSGAIAEVMANAGQLGIQNDYLVEFTRTMIDLGNSTDIAAGDAATAIAQFANVTNMAQTEFSNFGASLVDLGNNYATTESAILNMSTRLAAAGSQVGLLQSQILGFATALSSVGLEAEAGGTAFSKAMIQMQVAVETGNDSLADFARVSGLTEQAFKGLWNSDPAGAIEAFIVGLSRMDERGVSSIVTLEEMGFSEVRLRDTLMRATNATKLFASAQETANRAWSENTALTSEASKRYATTESRLKNLKNTAVLAAQRIGDDLSPTVQKLIDGANELLTKFMALDEHQRLMIVKFAAIAAAAGPAILAFSKVVKVVGIASTGIGKFATAVGKAGGGFSGFLSVLSKSPAVWFAVAAAVVVGTVALADYVSGAKEAREALKGMEETARSWKETAAETFYGASSGLSFFGMNEGDFARNTQSAQDWLDGLLAVWSDGQKETDEIVGSWTDSFKALTASTRDELQGLKDTADESGYTSVSDQLAKDIATLDSLDAEIAKLLKKRQNGNLSEKDKLRLQELIDAREAIEIKYKLSPADADGFDTVLQKVEAEVARAQARGQSDAGIAVYENAVVGLAEGMAAVNTALDEQYDKEYAVVQLIEDADERRAAQNALDAKYNADRRDAALEYAQALSQVVMPVWEQPEIQEAGAQVDDLLTKLREYSMAGESEKPALLTGLQELTSNMDEGSLTEYLSLMTQIQSLMDSGLTEAEIADLFPEVDFTAQMDQFAGIADYIGLIKDDLPGLYSMFNESLPEEALKIATDLDMTGAQARWDAFAADPGAITTDAIISGYTESETAAAQQPKVEAFITKYTETPEGADKASLTPTGLVAYVATYAEATGGADVSALNPANVTAMVSAYKELATGTDVSTLKPDEITAYIQKYLEEDDVDTSALTPDAITAFVLAYEEVTGGALTTSLTPDDVTAMVAKYLESEGIDISALTPGQIEAIVSSYAEATGCDKSQLLPSLTAYITEYREAEGVAVPKPQTRVVITGYDYLAYQGFKSDTGLELEVPVRLGELEQGELDRLLENGKVSFWKDGVEVPIEAVPDGTVTADTVATLDQDGTLHILITPEVTGTQEAIDAISPVVDEVDQLGTTALGRAAGILPMTTMDLIDSALGRILSYQDTLDYSAWDKFWASLRGESTDKGVLDTSMKYDFSAETVAELSAYVAEMVAAIQQGQAVSEEDLTNLKNIVTFLNGLDVTDTGAHVREGVAQGMTEAGWDSDAETVATNLETALNQALQINSPSKRVKPVGSGTAEGIGLGMTEYGFASDASTVAQNLQTALAAVLTATTLRSVGLNAMNGLKAGINAGRFGVIAAMRLAARAAVNSAKAELKIASPSRVFRDEVGRMAMKGLGQGALLESKAQAKVIRNAARFLSGEAQAGVGGSASYDNRKTYNQQATSTIHVEKLYVRDEQDIRSLAIEIASLTKRQQRGRGLRMA